MLSMCMVDKVEAPAVAAGKSPGQMKPSSCLTQTTSLPLLHEQEVLRPRQTPLGLFCPSPQQRLA